MSLERVDAIIIGSGQGAVPFAADRARSGKHVVLVERDRLGGSCVNYGCTPSKTLLAAAHNAGRARRAAALGVHADVRTDFPAIMHRVRAIREEFQAGVGERLRSAGVEVVAGQASFTAPGVIAAEKRTFSAPLILIDTGTSPLIPNVPGLTGTPFLTNRSIFDLDVLPPRTLVMGGGYIGLELGQGLARLGSEVHIIDHNARVLAREESDAAELLASSLREDGIALHLTRSVARVEHDGARFTLTLDDGARLTGEALLVATGRTPNTPALNAQAGGIALDERGTIRIDAQFRTSAAGVYAIGDVAGQPAFTHVSWEDHRRLEDILAGGTRTRDDRVLAYATYTEPQVARVGLTVAQAQAKGLAARAATLPLRDVARAREWGQTAGFFRLVVDERNAAILGATMVGYETAELIHVILAHMEAGSTWHVLDRSVHVHPTYAEGLPSLARLLA